MKEVTFILFQLQYKERVFKYPQQSVTDLNYVLKWCYDQKITFIFSSDFETMFAKHSPSEIISLNFEKKTVKLIDHLMNVLKTNRSRENIIELYRLRAELNKITEYRTKGAIVRSRIRWHEEGERNTKYFLNLEKRQHSKTHITKLKYDGREITDPDEILRSQRLFYKNLYTASPCDATQNDIFFLNANLPKLDKPEQDKLENPLRSEECYNVLKECAKGKCPGSDGLSVEFYLHFWSLLGEEMTQSFNYAFQRGQMNITQKQGIIKVIPKKKKDKPILKIGDLSLYLMLIIKLQLKPWLIELLQFSLNL